MPEVFNEQQLHRFDEVTLKRLAKKVGLHTRGRFNKLKMIQRILKAQTNGNGRVPSGARSGADIPTVEDESPELCPADELEQAEREDAQDNLVPESTEKKKDIAIEIMSRNDAQPFTQSLRTIVSEHHPHLEEARFLFFWKYNFRKHKDTNRVPLMSIKKANEEHRELAEKGDIGSIDFLVFVNYQEFSKGGPRTALLLAVLDEQLESCKPLEVDGSQKHDSANRLLWRLEEPLKVQPAVIGRHGFISEEHIRLAEECRKHKIQRPLFEVD